MDYDYDEVLDKRLKLMDMFDPSVIGYINHPCFDYIDQAHTSVENLKKALNENRNLIVFGEWLSAVRNHDPDRISNPKRHEQYMNYIRYMIVQFITNPWWYSRIGQEKWFFVCHARGDSTMPWGWDEAFTIDNWYRAGEKPRAYEVKPQPEVRKYEERFVFKKRG